MTDLALGAESLAFVGLYLLSLLVLGVWGKKKRLNNSLGDYYLAGRNLGLPVMLLTLFATQYSGNALFGFTGQAYRAGFSWIVIVHSMIVVVTGYLIFAPKLQRLAMRHQFVTPTDYIKFRFELPRLQHLISICLLLVLMNYTLAQLKVIGHVVEGLSGGRIDALWGVVTLALIMVVYSTLGGLRSVVWTDVLQGIMMLIGFILILVIIGAETGGFVETLKELKAVAPEKTLPPTGPQAVTWLSTIVLIGIGASVYPQAIQRIYAAKSASVLQQSMVGMSLMPLFAVVVVLTLGYLAIVRYPGLQGSAADQVMALILRDTLAFGWQGVAIVTVMLAAILAALMSTADSALLSFSSIFAKDIYGSLIDPSSPEERLTRIGQRCAWLVLAAMVFISTREDVTLYRLFVLKFELLLQVAPAFYLGVTNRHIAGKAVYWGLIVGLVVAVMGWLLGVMPLGLHPGTLGLAVNVLVIATWHMIRGINAPSGS